MKMEFRSFASSDLGIEGTVPQGWTEGNPGEFARGAAETDPTTLVQQLVPRLSIDQIEGLLLQRLGLREKPARVGGIETASLAWDLYAVERQDPDTGPISVDIALADAQEGACIVLLVTKHDDHDTLHYDVFVRAVDDFRVLSQKREATQPRPERKSKSSMPSAEVLLVKGDVLENDACDTVAELVRATLGLRTAFVDLAALEDADLDGVKLLFFPGGDCSAVRLSQKATRRVQAAVAGGMGYIGICCGAFLAAEATTMALHWDISGNSFGIFPGLAECALGEGVWPFYFNVHHPVLSSASLARELSPKMTLRFVGGTSNLSPSYRDGVPNWCIASLDEPAERAPVGKRAVMTATMFGEGRVFLSGPHPEAQKRTHAILQAAVEWCTHWSDPASDRQPLVVADIPDRGSAGRFLLCSATGSHDPLGFPVGFIWDFGDGSPRQYRPEAIHVYQEPGTYTVTLTVTTGAVRSVKSAKVTICRS